MNGGRNIVKYALASDLVGMFTIFEASSEEEAKTLAEKKLKEKSLGQEFKLGIYETIPQNDSFDYILIIKKDKPTIIPINQNAKKLSENKNPGTINVEKCELVDACGFKDVCRDDTCAVDNCNLADLCGSDHCNLDSCVPFDVNPNLKHNNQEG